MVWTAIEIKAAGMTPEPQSYATTPLHPLAEESIPPLASGEQGGPTIDSFSLTPRERQILELVWEGLNTREIGDALKVSAKTVEVHRAKIMKKLHARNTAEMIKLSIESGLIVLQDTF
jgi:DNA-binding NarL/FixJ family response regulator